MRNVIWRFIALAVLAVGTPLFNLAQNSASSPVPQEQRAKLDPPAAADKTNVPAAPAAAEKQELKPTVEQEIEALKNRIGQLETEVKQARAEALADSNDTAALKAAEKQLLAGTAAAAAPVASPAPPLWAGTS
jgi:hypothetical protein